MTTLPVRPSIPVFPRKTEFSTIPSAPGYLGTFDEPGVVVRFDNLRVYALEE